MTTFKAGDFAMTTRSPNGGGPVCVGPLQEYQGFLSDGKGAWSRTGEPITTTDYYGPLTCVARPWGEWANGKTVRIVRCDSDPGWIGPYEWGGRDRPPPDALFADLTWWRPVEQLPLENTAAGC